jgi:uncharacterized membrane protein YvbJ
MNSSVEQSINEICERFCEDFGYSDCVEIEKGIDSKEFKVIKKKTKKEICLKIILESEFNKNKEEWNINKLLKKYKIFFLIF